MNPVYYNGVITKTIDQLLFDDNHPPVVKILLAKNNRSLNDCIHLPKEDIKIVYRDGEEAIWSFLVA